MSTSTWPSSTSTSTKYYISDIKLLQSTANLTEASATYTRQLKSASWSMNSNSWEMSYVMEGLLGFIFLRYSSNILHVPVHKHDSHDYVNLHSIFFLNEEQP